MHFQEAMRLAGLCPRHNNYGCALQEQGKLTEAMDHFNIALGFNPQFPEALCNRGNAHLDHEQLH